MSKVSRRDFLRQGSLGLGSVTAAGLVLRAGAEPTPGSGTLGNYAHYLHRESLLLAQAQKGGQPELPDVRNFVNDRRAAQVQLPNRFAVTEDNILGPFYRMGAPFRGKVTPPLEAGTVLQISGRVWAFDTRRPLPSAVIDIWQANSQGRYDNDDPNNPPARDLFRNRTRLITDETGYYEFETIHPGRYLIGPNTWRPAHIHYLVRAQGYRQLITQLYFQGDPHNRTDEFIKESLIIQVSQVRNPAGTYEAGTFDIVLAPGDANRR
jgi:catechol 1,2-dioxygenase